MTDLDERFRRAKQLPPPDLWSEVLRRADGTDDSGTVDGSTDRGSLRGRVAAGVVAFATFMVAAVFVWTGFRAGPSAPADLAPTQGASSRSFVTTLPGAPSDYRYLYPFFREREGWHVHDQGEVPDGAGSVAWASTIPFDPADLDPAAPAIPPSTIEQLPPDGVVLTAEVVPSAFDPSLGPWPPGSLDGLRLAQATVRGPDAEEPPGDYAVYEIDGPYVLIRAYFGDAHPSPSSLDAAQAELDTLEVPPVCPVPAEGSFPDTMILGATDVTPGETVSVFSLMPFQHEDGSYDRGADTVIELWWDAEPESWVQLLSETPPAGTTLLAKGGPGSCFLSATLTVPVDAALGDHRVVALETNDARDEGTLFGTVVLHVTA
jgi:hypothetical protein